MLACGDVHINAQLIRVQERPTCLLCESPGEVLYQDLDDALFGVEGVWSMARCTNRECGLLWLNPQPIEEDVGKAYARYFTHEERGAQASTTQRIYRRTRGSYLRARLGYEGAASGGAWRGFALLAHLHPGSGDVFAAWAMFLRAPQPGSSLLDIGCGDGDLLVRMRDLGWRVAGVETDSVAVERARSRGLDVHLGDLEGAQFPAESFDAITMAHVIEHVHDPRRLLVDCRRLLKPTGSLVLLTPNSESWGHRHFGRDWLSLDPPRHLHLFNRRNIRRLLESAQLTPERIATLPINASAVWPASAAIRRERSLPSDERSNVTLTTTMTGVARQAAERMVRSVDREAGEDLLAIAVRIP